MKLKFRELARKYHPDKSHGAVGDDGGERFKWARKAYEILSNAESRRAFDNQQRMAKAVQQAAALARATLQRKTATSAGTPQADGRKRGIDETTPRGGANSGDAKRQFQGGGGVGGGGREGVASQVISCPTALPGLEVGACHPLPSSPARAVLRSARAAGMGGAQRRVASLVRVSSLFLFLSLSLSLSRKHTHTLSLSLSQTHTPTHTHALSCSLAFSLRLGLGAEVCPMLFTLSATPWTTGVPHS